VRDAFDHSRLVATTGYVYDQGAAIGEIVLGSPHARLLDFRFRGAAAHAGMHPEDGRSAIAAASRAIADFRLGPGRRRDERQRRRHHRRNGSERRPGVVLVQRGSAITRRAEGGRPRTRDARERRLRRRASPTAQVESEVRPSFSGYRFRESDAPVRLAAEALERAGYTPSYALSGGGADANVFNARGLRCVNLANGMMEIHTPTSTSPSPTSRGWSRSRSRSWTSRARPIR
jgi:tripeptide aminopeptidase